MTTWRTLALGVLACLCAGPLRAAAPMDDPSYWNVLYYPGTDHGVRFVAGVADDLPSLLQWLGNEHPKAKVAHVRGDVYDVLVPATEADAILEYFTAALGQSNSWTGSLTPQDLRWSWVPEHRADIGSLIDRWLSRGADGEGTDEPPVRITSDYSELREKIPALEREKRAAGAALAARPGIAALVDEELRMLRNYQRVDQVFNADASIRLIMRPPERALEDAAARAESNNFAAEFLRAWRLDLDSMEPVDGMPFIAGSSCEMTPYLAVYLFADDVDRADEKIRTAAARAGAEVDDACFPQAADGGTALERKFFVTVDPAVSKSFREEVESLGRFASQSRPASLNVNALDARYEALRREVSAPAGFLRTAPAIRGLVKAELARLRPVAQREQKTRGRNVFEFVLRTAGPGPAAPPADSVGYRPPTPAPADLPSGTKPDGAPPPGTPPPPYPSRATYQSGQ